MPPARVANALAKAIAASFRGGLLPALDLPSSGGDEARPTPALREAPGFELPPAPHVKSRCSRAERLRRSPRLSLTQRGCVQVAGDLSCPRGRQSFAAQMGSLPTVAARPDPRPADRQDSRYEFRRTRFDCSKRRENPRHWKSFWVVVQFDGVAGASRP